MALKVVNGAQLTCAMGTSPSSLVILPANQVMAGNQPAATIQDFIPNENIMPFGMCNCPANPQVAAATTAALGVLTPQPCIPATAAPWTPGALTVEIANLIALDDSSVNNCTWGGVIKITSAGETTVELP